MGKSLYPDRVDYLPIHDRPKIIWPDKAKIALWVAPNIEHYEYTPETPHGRDPWPRVPHPDVREFSYRDYGNRVGFWRMLDSMDRYRIRCTVSLNMAVLEHFPEIGRAIVDRPWDIMSHGIYNTRYMYGMTDDDEMRFYRDNIDTLYEHTGKKLKGMLGPACSETENMPDLMAKSGLIYTADFLHDDQPVPINVQTGKLVSVPYSVELNDHVLFTANYDGDGFVRRCIDQFDRLYSESSQSGRVMCIPLHPFLIGQPHRIKYLDKVFQYISQYEGVWQTTADEIAEYFIEHYYDDYVERAINLKKDFTDAC